MSALHSFRESVADTASIGAYLGLLLLGFWLEFDAGWKFMAVVCGAVAFAAWILSFRRLKAMEGTPTSRIASAAQGYVELIGRGSSPPNFRVLSKLTGLPCLWYQYQVEEKTGDNKWKVISRDRSTESFLLDDGSGVCLVDPENAEVLSRNKDTWTQGSYRYTEWLIPPNDKVYVIGEFTTLGGANLEFDEKRDVGELLAEWKRDRPALLGRFDLDKDGQVSEKEWTLARAQARREIRKHHGELRAQPGTHVVHRPRDDRLFMISNHDPAGLLRRYRFWAWLHLAVFLVSVSFAAQLAGIG